MSGKKKVIEHPSTVLAKKVQAQQKQIEALQLDVSVLRDLLTRTIRILAKYESDGFPALPDPSDLPEN